MQKKVIEFNKEQRGEDKMDFQSGDVVKVHLKIKEGGKERVQVFEGLVIAIKSRQSSSPKITVRKVSHGVGVEMIIPLLSKNVQKIELIKKAKVRRAKLYYVRSLTAKQSRMKYRDMNGKNGKENKEKVAEAKKEKVEEKEVAEVKAAPKKKKVEKKEESK
jgi:large subunit ribosomal protein L19